MNQKTFIVMINRIKQLICDADPKLKMSNCVSNIIRFYQNDNGIFGMYNGIGMRIFSDKVQQLDMNNLHELTAFNRNKFAKQTNDITEIITDFF